MGSQGELYTMDEVSKYNSREKCWLVIHGKVYDVTKFLDDHPGGDEVIIASTGKDATEDFEDTGHSSTARAMIDEFYIGDIDAETMPRTVKYIPPKETGYDQDNTTEFIIRLLQFLVPLIILGVAVWVRYYRKSSD